MNPGFDNNQDNITITILRYLSFWPWYLISLVFFILVSYSYLRYVDYLYNSSSVIEILDKSQESEMSLPTSMTVFNRKMVNLDNEIGVLKSFTLHEEAVKKTKLNIELYKEGKIKRTRITFDNASTYLNNLIFHIKPEDIEQNTYFSIISDDGNVEILHFNQDDDILIKEYEYKSISADPNNTDLPFYFEVNKKINFSISIYFKKFSKVVNSSLKNLKVDPLSTNRDQLNISTLNTNPIIGANYVNTLLS